MLVGDEPTAKAGLSIGTLRASMWSTEVMTLAMLLLFTMLNTWLFASVQKPLNIYVTNTIVAVGLVSISVWYQTTGNRLAYLLRSFYVLPIIFMMYAEVHAYIPHINPAIFDPVLARWDRAIFGLNPTEWMAGFATPWLTEYFQIWYSLFHPMLVVPALGFFLRSHYTFRVYAMTLMFGFYLSYLLYFIMPAIGPRFELHNFWTMNQDLPGLLLTEPIRAYINAANNVVVGQDPFMVVNRDCMPSGHTMMSLLCILMSWRYGSRFRWLITVGGASVIISTVYLWYHYVVDVIAGAALAVLVFWLHPYLAKMWQRLGVRV